MIKKENTRVVYYCKEKKKCEHREKDIHQEKKDGVCYVVYYTRVSGSTCTTVAVAAVGGKKRRNARVSDIAKCH